MKPIYISPFGKWHIIQCPECRLQARIDQDQLSGKVSIDCPDCNYHETHDITKDMPKKIEKCPVCVDGEVKRLTTTVGGYRHWVYECLECETKFTTTESDEISLRMLKE